MTAQLRARPEGCLSDLLLDRILANECTPEARDGASEHMDRCEACHARFEALSKERDAFAEREPAFADAFAAPRRDARPRRLRATWAASAAALAMAAAALLVLRPKPPADAGSTRMKGSSRIGFYVKRGEAVTLGAPGARVQPGDAVRFVYSATEERHLAVLSLDGARRASVYYPAGPTAERVEPAVDRALPSSTVLDATLGQETVYALFCKRPVELEPIRAGLEATGRAPLVEGCEVDTLVLEKEASRER
jgi:hypothetical protein